MFLGLERSKWDQVSPPIPTLATGRPQNNLLTADLYASGYLGERALKYLTQKFHELRIKLIEASLSPSSLSNGRTTTSSSYRGGLFTNLTTSKEADNASHTKAFQPSDEAHQTNPSADDHRQQVTTKLSPPSPPISLFLKQTFTSDDHHRWFDGDQCGKHF